MIIEKGYAKINLGLEVVNKREDGFHNLAMIMAPLNLYDELYFEEINSKEIVIECDKLKHVKTEDNLVYKAISLIKEQYSIKKGIKVRIVKRIPDRAGLGGGSADAAAALRAVNRFWNLGLDLDTLARLGAQIGSDIPFMVYNKTAKVTGRGEVIEFIEEIPFASIILVIPKFQLSTADVFHNFRLHGYNKGKIEKLADAVKAGDIEKISENLFNDLEVGIERKEIENIKKDLIQSGALGSAMTGSGSTVFGISLNEKHARNVEKRFLILSSQLYGNDRNGRKTILTSFRSGRKPVLSKLPTVISKRNKILDTLQTRAYGTIFLGYQTNLDHYKYIQTPISLSDIITVSKTENPVCEIYFDEVLDSFSLTNELKKTVNHLGYGLIVRISRRINPSLGIISEKNYLAAILSSLSNFGEKVDILFSLYSKETEVFRTAKTVLYDSKSDKVTILSDAVFGYVVIAPLNIFGYQSPKYTKQVNPGLDRLDAIINGIENRNFYQMASGIFNSLYRFEIRRIEEHRGIGFVGKLEEICLNSGASGFTVIPGGRAVLAICRNEKQAQKILGLLQNRCGLRDITISSIKSDITHQTIFSPVLNETKFIEPDTDKWLDEEKVFDQFDNAAIEDGSPFDNTGCCEYDNYDEVSRRRKSRKKEIPIDIVFENDIEGILALHDGGSLFKQYDFKDIAAYFDCYFHGKEFRFLINGEIVNIRFNNSRLPHILGIHLINEKDMSLRGYRGFQRLMNNEISFNKLKKFGAVSEKTLTDIFNKTRSTVLIFNDIFHGRLDNITQFDRNFLVSHNSLMSKFEFGLTKKIADNSFHTQYVLGLGKESENSYYLYTSYLWKFPASVGKKDGSKVGISR